ncbi:MAG: hypothetical protein B5M55_06405 [Desulfococcus sp. 4484_242]|nr:MAG: hypothetical protein B5M55_06405 [Desulfococcus sp. 4484_242]
MIGDGVPEFAVVGHPNEGKSAVVSTLAEDDTVRVTPYPGETVACQTFPVVVDGKAIIRFIDTPGFQNPKRTFKWIKGRRGDPARVLSAYLRAHAHRPDFKDDCRLLEPIAAGAGIIYVVDGSRPVRNLDLAEMEILRLTGRPRMAVINCKEHETAYIETWKHEFRKHFNTLRVFNANRATYAERIELLETLKGIDQDWGPALEKAIAAFKADWDRRNIQTAHIICDMMETCLTYSIVRSFTEKTGEKDLRERLQREYAASIEKIEQKAHQKIRRLFKHNIFNYALPAHSLLNEALFSKKTWQFLGLAPKQLIAAAGITGGAVGAALDLAAGGLTFGVFTAAGGLLGVGWAALGGARRLARMKVVGLPLGGEQIQVGPMENIQFLYVLLDRALLFYSHVINWAHGRRDSPPAEKRSDKPVKAGLTFEWDDKRRRICQTFYKAVRGKDDRQKTASRKALIEMIEEVLLEILHSEKTYGMVGR